MSKRWPPSVVAAVAIVALVATAAILIDGRNGDTPAQPTATPSTTEFPEGVVIDYSDPELCPAAGEIDSCFVAGSPAPGIPIDEYFLQYLRVRAELGSQLSAPPRSVRVYSVHRVDWSSPSLGATSDKTVPGFNIVVEANGALYVYHTSATSFEFAGTTQRE